MQCVLYWKRSKVAPTSCVTRNEAGEEEDPSWEACKEVESERDSEKYWRWRMCRRSFQSRS